MRIAVVTEVFLAAVDGVVTRVCGARWNSWRASATRF